MCMFDGDTPVLSDRFAAQRGVLPTLDASNDLTLTASSKTDTTISCTFTRPLSATEAGADRPIAPGAEPAVIWAVGPVGTDGEPDYHIQRGFDDISSPVVGFFGTAARRKRSDLTLPVHPGDIDGAWGCWEHSSAAKTDAVNITIGVDRTSDGGWGGWEYVSSPFTYSWTRHPRSPGLRQQRSAPRLQRRLSSLAILPRTVVVLPPSAHRHQPGAARACR